MIRENTRCGGSCAINARYQPLVVKGPNTTEMAQSTIAILKGSGIATL
jgi:hypothetical protein